MGTTACKQPAPLFKVAVLVIWLLLLGLLLKREVFISSVDPREAAALAQAEREEYQSIFFQDKKIGFVVNIYHPREDRKLTIEQRARMTLNVAGSSHAIDLRLEALLGEEGRLENFNFSFQSPFYRMQAEGKTTYNKVAFRLSTGSTTIEDQLELSSQPMLSTSRRAYLLKKDLKIGEKIRIPWFDPVSLTGKDSVIEYRGRERILIHGRVENLHHFVEVFSGARINSWLDDTGDVLKEESPAGFVFLKESKFKALAGSDESPELLAAVSAKIIGSMPDLEGLAKIRYRLQFPDDGGFQLDSGRQHYADGLLTIERENLPEADNTSTSPCPAEQDNLKATKAVQADHAKIRQLAEEITKGQTDPMTRLRSIATWVYKNIEKRPVLGLPDALTTLDSRRGDCNEHAVLFAALARAVGIPCRIASGVMYLKDAFYYHAWNEVCVNGRWLSLDTTTNQLPADLSHIKFIEGEIKEQMRIGSLLGQLTIEPLPAALPLSVQPAVGTGNQPPEDSSP